MTKITGTPILEYLLSAKHFKSTMSLILVSEQPCLTGEEKGLRS